MKMNKRSFLFFRLLSTCLLLEAVIISLISCGGQDEKMNPEDYKLKVLCDEAIYDLMNPLFSKFDSIYVKEEITVEKTTAWDAMAKFLKGEEKVIILGRDYSRIEDSLIRSHGMEPYLHLKMAQDGLVFYAANNFPLDTMTDDQIKDVLSNKGSSLLSYYPKLESEPEFVTNSLNSSELENLKQIVLKYKPIEKKIKLLPNYDSVKQYVLNHPNTIGVGYLSQIIHEPNLKAISISFYDSAGNYIFPHVVHQANFVQGFYPYTVNFYVYLYDKNKDLFLKFGRFMSKGPVSQRYFNEAGIVPAFGDIRLRQD